jgi:aryl-alcohol dehydrogenase-like predicted oxidoreductase
LVGEISGRWHASRPAEIADWVGLATKGRFPPGTDINAAGSSRRGLSRSLDGVAAPSRLRPLDLYQLHDWDPLTPAEDTLTLLDDAVRSRRASARIESARLVFDQPADGAWASDDFGVLVEVDLTGPA